MLGHASTETEHRPGVDQSGRKFNSSRMDEGELMTRIVQLLTQKNHYLEKFYALNEEELANFQIGNFDSIDAFYQTREKILETIRYIDIQIVEVQQEFPVEGSSSTNFQVEPQVRKEVKEHLAIKDEYVNRILAQDLEILECIEQAKSEIIRELMDLKKNRRALSGYKSKSFTHRLNEEA